MAAPVAKIALTPAVATSAAAASGPTTVPALSSTDVVLFAATSSCGVLASDGKQRLQRGPEERRRDADDRCRSDDGVAVVRKRSERRDRQRGRTDDGDREQEPLATEAIRERRGERSEHGGGQHPRHARDADRRGSTDAIGEDAERDEVRPLRGDETSPRKLGPPQRRAARRDDETRSSRVRPHRASQPFARRKGNAHRCPWV